MQPLQVLLEFGGSAANVWAMTKFEKLALDSIAAMCDVTASLLSDNGTKAHMLSDHLPGLTDEARQELKEQADVQAANARQLKENARVLRTITGQPDN